jgi:hypothetical protein
MTMSERKLRTKIFSHAPNAGVYSPDFRVHDLRASDNDILFQVMGTQFSSSAETFLSTERVRELRDYLSELLGEPKKPECAAKALDGSPCSIGQHPSGWHASSPTWDEQYGTIGGAVWSDPSALVPQRNYEETDADD